MILKTKDEAANFNANITKTDDFKSFKHKAKLLETTVAQAAPNNASGIATIAKMQNEIGKMQQLLRH